MNVQHIYENSNKAIDSLNNQLLLLRDNFANYLEQEDIKYDVDCLVEWIDSCKQGNLACEEWFAEYGESLVKNIKQKIDLALRDQLNIDAESPSTDKNSFRKIDDLSKAAKIASKAERKMQKTLAEEEFNLNNAGGPNAIN